MMLRLTSDRLIFRVDLKFRELISTLARSNKFPEQIYAQWWTGADSWEKKDSLHGKGEWVK